MKLRLLLIPAIAVTATALGASPDSAHAESGDAQAQAAALLSRPHTPASLTSYERSSSAAVDAHASAAALLRGDSSGPSENVSARITASTVAPIALGAHAHAAALLRGSHISVGERLRATDTSEPLGEHPAVLVARTWDTRGIDPSTFIVAHPARLELLRASPTDSSAEGAGKLSMTLNK